MGAITGTKQTRHARRNARQEQYVNDRNPDALPSRGLGLGSPLRSLMVLAASLLAAASAWGENKPSAVPNMFSPTSTPAHEEYVMSLFVIGITAGILLVVGGAWAYVTWRFRSTDPSEVEPPQVYGSPQVELAWTIVPVIIVVVLFLTTARMIFAIQDHPKPSNALEVTVVGHQFWWEYRYPQYGVVTADEMHVPMSPKNHPRPTFMKLLSADVWHSYWVPQLAGKVDNIPDHENDMWIDPQVPGVYVGQCGQFCGVEHAKMLIRVYVDTPDQFQRWITRQQQPAVEAPGAPRGEQPGIVNASYSAAGGSPQTGLGSNSGYSPDRQAGSAQTNPGAAEVAAGRQVFMTNACMNCHAIQGTVANGRFGPDLTHLGSRDTIGSGIMANNVDSLKTWIRNPSDVKEGALMPPMQLNESQLEQVSVYLSSLK